MKNFLPPLVSEIESGSITWRRLEGLDHEVMGLFLSCHLIIEHYLDEYLKITYPSLDWDAAKHTFNQKVSMLSKFKVSDKYDCIPAIKHMNTIRNRLSHNIEFRINASDLLPLIQYLEKTYEDKAKIPTEPKEIISQFTNMSCVLFAGCISGYVSKNVVTRK